MDSGKHNSASFNGYFFRLKRRNSSCDFMCLLLILKGHMESHIVNNYCLVSRSLSCSISSAFTNSLQFKSSGSIRNDAVVFPAPLQPAIIKSRFCMISKFHEKIRIVLYYSFAPKNLKPTFSFGANQKILASIFQSQFFLQFL